MDTDEKTVYICGALTELPPEEQESVKKFYSKLGDLCGEVTGKRAFVPHEHYDPIRHANFTPADVDKAERDQVCNHTSLVLVATFTPSWGGGIEVEMAYRSNVPVIVLCERSKLEQRKISRLLRGNPAVISVISYDTEEEVVEKLRKELKTYTEASLC